MTHDSTINHLRDKLDMLSRFDRERSLFGAREPFGHGYRVSPVTEAEIISKEAEFGISFPEEYRVWLLRVGSGAGPDYGLFPLARITAKLLEDERGFGGEIESPQPSRAITSLLSRPNGIPTPATIPSAFLRTAPTVC